MGSNKEVFDAELEAMRLALDSWTRPGHLTICSDSQAAIARLRSTDVGAGQLVAVRILNAIAARHARGDGEVAVRWVPGHKGLEGNERADKAAKEAAAGSAPVGPGYTSIAFIRRVITERKWADAEAWLAKRRTPGDSHVAPKKKDPDPTLFSAPKRIAQRLFQLRTGHALIGVHYKRMGIVESDRCRWCKRARESRDHLLRHCPRWKKQQARLWREIDEAAREAEDRRVWRRQKIAAVLAEPMFVKPLLYFLSTTGIGIVPPKGEG